MPGRHHWSTDLPPCSMLRCVCIGWPLVPMSWHRHLCKIMWDVAVVRECIEYSFVRGLEPTIVPFVVAKLLPRRKEHIGQELTQDVFDLRFLLLLDTRLPLHMVYEQIGSILQYRLVFVVENQMRPAGRLILIGLFVSLQI